MTPKLNSAIRIVDVAFTHELAKPLVAAAQLELASRYGNSDRAAVDAEDFFPPNGAFFLAVHGEQPVGCLGIRRLAPEDSAGYSPALEAKRLYVDPECRGVGIARELMRVAELRARAMGVEYVLLETGLKQPEAIRLYEGMGYQRIHGFGHYQQYDSQRAFMKDLRDSMDLRR